MSSDTTMMIVQFLPTILAVFIIVFSIIGGLIRGFRKSFILFINFLIGIVVGFISYFEASKIMLSNELGTYMSSFGPQFSNVNSLYDLVKVILETYLPDYAAVAANPYIEQAAMVFVGLGVSLVMGIICLVLVPLVVRFFLYIIYQLFFLESRYKRHKLAEGDDYNPHRILGMFVGAARGVVSALLAVSIVTSTYFVLSGGIVEADEQPTENILILDNLSDSVGFDLNALYKGLKASRTTGVGKIFDAILIEGKPADLYYADLFLSSNINEVKEGSTGPIPTNSYLDSDEKAKAELAKLCIREELALIVKLLENVLETNAITIADGKVVIDYELLQESLDEYVNDFVTNSTLIGDVVPLAIIGAAESINDGTLVIDDSIKSLFTDEVIEEIIKIDFSTDIAKLISTLINAVDLIPVDSETNSINFAAFSDINTYLSFDVEKVKTLFNGLSEVNLLTKVVFPAGIGFALNTYGSTLEEVGIKIDELNFNGLSWQDEIKNMGVIYEKVVALDLDINKLMDTAINESTGLGNNIQYIIDLCNDEEKIDGVEKSEIFKTNLVNLIDSIFASDLFSQVGLVFIKSKIVEFEILYEDGTSTPLNDALNLVKENLNNYKPEDLRADLTQLATSCLGVTSLIPLFIGTGEEINIFEILYSLEVDDVKESLLGTYTENNGVRTYTSGLYSLRLLNGSFHKDANYAIDYVIEGALKTYASEIVSIEKVDSITTVNGNKLKPTDALYDFTAWPNELGALVDAIKELQTVEHLDEINMGASNIADILPPEIGADEIDVITKAASKSILLSGIIEEKLITIIKNEPSIGYAAKDPNIVWMDTIVVNQGEEVVTRGELNSLLKAFIIFSDDKKGIDLNDPDTLINGLAHLLHEAESTDVIVKDGLDYQEVVTFASSQVLMTILSKEISNINSDNSGMSIVVPYSLNTSYVGNEDAWKKWAYDDSLDYKNGEFAKVVVVLYHAREYLNKTQVATSSTDTREVSLTQNNLINSVIYMEQDDLVTKSDVLYASLSDAILNQANSEGSIIKVRNGVVIDNPNLNPDAISSYDVVSEIEVDKALDVIRYMNLTFINNDFSQINLQTFLNAIKGENGLEARKSICLSNIFNISTINKITENSETAQNKGIDVPSAYKHYVDGLLVVNLEYSKWYPESEANWASCELNKMLLGVVAAGISADDTQNNIKVPRAKDLFEDIYKDPSKLDVIYDSDIFKYTISCKITNQDEVVVRPLAYEGYDPTDLNKKLEFIEKDEISKIVVFLHDTGIDIENHELDAQHIFTHLKNGSIREQICKSNILNATMVDKIGGVGPVPDTYALVFPSSYLYPEGSVNAGCVIKDLDLWYPKAFTNTDTTWMDCELNKLLISIAELDVNATGNKINFAINEKIDTLLKDSVIEPTDAGGNTNTKLDVVYHSDIIADTISRRLMDTDVRVPYIDHNQKLIFDEIPGRRELVDHIIHEDEVETLLRAIFSLGLGFSTTGFDYEHVFDNIELSKLSTNVADPEVSILNSSLLHLLVSEKLIAQKQTVAGAEYEIITKTYYKDSSTTTTVVDTFTFEDEIYRQSYTYVRKEEIEVAITSLSLAGITKIDDAASINRDRLAVLFGTEEALKQNQTLVNNIAKSAILSKIFGQILISETETVPTPLGNQTFSLYQAIGDKVYNDLNYYTCKTVKTVSDVDASILSLADVNSIINGIHKLNN